MPWRIKRKPWHQHAVMFWSHNFGLQLLIHLKKNIAAGRSKNLTTGMNRLSMEVGERYKSKACRLTLMWVR
jgi:hypothetical protein